MSQAKSPAAAATASPAAPASTPADRAAADRAQAQQLLDKAIALIKAQKLDEAEGVLGDLMSRHPGEPEVWYNAGGVAKLRKETERAVQRMRKAVSLAPTVAKYRHDLGRLLFELGRID